MRKNIVCCLILIAAIVGVWHFVAFGGLAKLFGKLVKKIVDSISGVAKSTGKFLSTKKDQIKNVVKNKANDTLVKVYSEVNGVTSDKVKLVPRKPYNVDELENLEISPNIDPNFVSKYKISNFKKHLDKIDRLFAKEKLKYSAITYCINEFFNEPEGRGNVHFMQSDFKKGDFPFQKIKDKSSRWDPETKYAIFYDQRVYSDKNDIFSKCLSPNPENVISFCKSQTGVVVEGPTKVLDMWDASNSKNEEKSMGSIWHSKIGYGQFFKVYSICYELRSQYQNFLKCDDDITKFVAQMYREMGKLCKVNNVSIAMIPLLIPCNKILDPTSTSPMSAEEKIKQMQFMKAVAKGALIGMADAAENYQDMFFIYVCHRSED